MGNVSLFQNEANGENFIQFQEKEFFINHFSQINNRTECIEYAKSFFRNHDISLSTPYGASYLNLVITHIKNEDARKFIIEYIISEVSISTLKKNTNGDFLSRDVILQQDFNLYQYLVGLELINLKKCKSPLVLALEIEWLHPEFFEFCLNKGAELFIKEYNGKTILHLISKKFYENMRKAEKLVRYILELNPNYIHARDDRGRTPLLYAAKSCNTFMFMLYLRYGGSIWDLDDYTRNFVDYYIMGSKIENFAELICRIHEIKHRNTQWKLCLIYMIKKEKSRIIVTSEKLIKDCMIALYEENNGLSLIHKQRIRQALNYISPNIRFRNCIELENQLLTYDFAVRLKEKMKVVIILILIKRGFNPSVFLNVFQLL